MEICVASTSWLLYFYKINIQIFRWMYAFDSLLYTHKIEIVVWYNNTVFSLLRLFYKVAEPLKIPTSNAGSFP